MSPIEWDTVSGLQPRRCGAQICTGCLKQKVILVRNQAEGVDRQAKSLDGFLDGLENPLAIRIIAINRLAFICSRRDMIHGVGVFHSNRSGHGTWKAAIDAAVRQVSKVDPTPSFLHRTTSVSVSTERGDVNEC